MDRLSEIVDELLILSRAGERESPGEEFDVAQAADRARERWGKTADDAGVELTRGSAGEAGTCWCAPADFDRAIDVLIENAIRYSPRGSQVRIVTEPGRIEVLDDGPGLQAGEEEKIFERFRRGSASSGIRVPASACRSRASWRANGADPSGSRTVTRAAARVL